MSFPIQNGTLPAIQESYELLAVELDTVLSDQSELYSNMQTTDVLGVLLGKIDNIKHENVLDYDTQAELRNLEESIYTSILGAFKEEFPICADTIDTAFNETEFRLLAEVIYSKLYIGRKDLLLNFLVTSTLDGRVNIAKRYRTNDSKRDITYHAIRSDLQAGNPDLYIILMHSHDICEDYLFDENLGLDVVLSYTDNSEEEQELLERLFEGVEAEALSVLTSSLRESHYFNEFKTNFKLQLNNAARGLVQQ